MKIILASSSKYRSQLLEKLNISFESDNPNIDEKAHNNELPETLVSRLAKEKATALSNKYPQHLIIGSDQIAHHDNQILGKPNNHNNALKQLEKLQGQEVQFLTGLCLLNSRTKKAQTTVITTTVTYRKLTNTEIDFYLKQDKPYDCAGSFKSEGFGISILEKIEGSDPNALIGLPLIALQSMLLKEGINPLAPKN